MMNESLVSNTAAWQDSAASKAWDAIESRGLTHHLQELLNYGLTVIPPEAIGISQSLTTRVSIAFFPSRSCRLPVR